MSSPPEGNQARIDELTAAGDRHSADTLDLRRDRSAGEQHPARTAALIATDPNGSPSSLRRYYPRPGSGCQRQPDLFNADSDRGQKLSPLIDGIHDRHWPIPAEPTPRSLARVKPRVAPVRLPSGEPFLIFPTRALIGQ